MTCAGDAEGRVQGHLARGLGRFFERRQGHRLPVRRALRPEELDGLVGVVEGLCLLRLELLDDAFARLRPRRVDPRDVPVVMQPGEWQCGGYGKGGCDESERGARTTAGRCGDTFRVHGPSMGGACDLCGELMAAFVYENE